MPPDEQRAMALDQVRVPAAILRVARRLTCSVGIAGGTLLATGQLNMFAVVVGVLTSLPMLLIIMLVVVAVFSSHPVRRKTAERILSQLLTALTGTRQQ